MAVVVMGLSEGTDRGDRWAGCSWDGGGKERRWRGGGGEGDLGRRAQGGDSSGSGRDSHRKIMAVKNNH